MRANQWIASASIVAIGALLATVPALAQQVTGTPGSPEATTTIEGNQLPPPPQKFEGKIERNELNRRRIGRHVWCRPRVRPTSF